MRGRACSRRGSLATVCAGWRRALPLLAATMIVLPGSVAYAAQPTDGSARIESAYLVTQTDTERRCLIRCNEPEKPKPGTRLQQAAEKARTVVQDARDDAREAISDVREAAGKAHEAVGEAKEATGEILDAETPREAVAEVKEGAGEVKEALTDPPPTTEPTSSEAMSSAPPTEATPQDTGPAQAAHPEPVPATGSSMSTSPSISAASAPAVGPSAVSQAPAETTQPDASAQTAVRRPDGVAGGPNTSIQRPEPGTFGQGKDPEAAPAPPAVAVAPPIATPPSSVEPAAGAAVQGPPVAATVAVPLVPSAPAVASDPPRAAAPDDAPAPSDGSTIELADWSVPLAIAGALVAGAAIMVPLSRRRQPPGLSAGAQGRALSNPGASPASAYRSASAPHPDDRPGAYPGEHQTIGDSIMRSPTLHTLRPVNNAYYTAPNARLNGSPVPYLRPVRSRADKQREHSQQTDLGTRPGYSTNVDGLAWPEPSTGARGDRALA